MSTLSTMLLLIHLLSNISVNYYRSIHPLLGSPFHKKGGRSNQWCSKWSKSDETVGIITDEWSTNTWPEQRKMSIHAGLWQRSDQAPVNEDEQVNDTHINNCFNQTISQFVLYKRASTDVLWTLSIPLNSTPSTCV